MEKKVVKNNKKLRGEVIKVSGENTIKVLVETKSVHPLYGKIIKEHKKYLVHCEDEGVEIGDLVLIEEGRPMSSRKCFYFVKKLSK